MPMKPYVRNSSLRAWLALEKKFRLQLNVTPLSTVLEQRSVKMVRLSLFCFALLLPLKNDVLSLKKKLRL